MSLAGVETSNAAATVTAKPTSTAAAAVAAAAVESDIIDLSGDSTSLELSYSASDRQDTSEKSSVIGAAGGSSSTLTVAIPDGTNTGINNGSINCSTKVAVGVEAEMTSLEGIAELERGRLRCLIELGHLDAVIDQVGTTYGIVNCTMSP
jgi:hypothetical protein